MAHARAARHRPPRTRLRRLVVALSLGLCTGQQWYDIDDPHRGVNGTFDVEWMRELLMGAHWEAYKIWEVTGPTIQCTPTSW